MHRIEELMITKKQGEIVPNKCVTYFSTEVYIYVCACVCVCVIKFFFSFFPEKVTN